MKILGVTGGSGTGKSVVCRMLKDQGAKVIDADKIAAKVQRSGTPCFAEIVACFGQDMVDSDGELNRKKLASVVFSDPAKLRQLNGLVHGYVSREIKRRVEFYRNAGEQLVVLDVPVPVEDGFFDTADNVWAVVANNDLRVERLMKRMGISEEEAERRIAAQLTNREYEELADVTILNESGVSDLKKLVLYELRRFQES